MSRSVRRWTSGWGTVARKEERGGVCPGRQGPGTGAHTNTAQCRQHQDLIHLAVFGFVENIHM